MNFSLLKLLFVVLFLSFKTSYSQGDKDEAKTEDQHITLAVVEEVPIFPGCEDLSSHSEKRKCMQKMFSKHIARKFYLDVVTPTCIESKVVEEKEVCVKSEYWKGFSSGKTRLYAKFIINKEGIVSNINVRAPHERLKEETERVLKLLPKMTPARHRGKAVSVPYTLPIALVFDEQ